MHNKPRISIADLVGGLLVYIGYLLFLVVLHLLAINNTGDISSVLSTVFSVLLYVYIGMLIFGLVAVVIQLFRWLTWVIETPDWKKKEARGKF